MVTCRRREPLVRALCVLGALVLLGACGRGGGTRGAGASASAVSSGFVPVGSHGERVRLLEAEQRRASGAITAEDVQHVDVRVRRAAVRALARIADARAVELLSKSLADEDHEVVVFSAYGLGYACRGHERAVVSRLSLRAASLLAGGPPAGGATHPTPKQTPLASPLEAVTDALARCATPEAEHALRAMVAARGAAAAPAALALGSLASRRGRLEDATVVALLDAASQKPALEQALYPFSRTTTLGEMARERLLGVARTALAAGSSPIGKAFALRALGATGEAGVADLGAVVLDAKAPATFRADAARTLARGGESAQKELALVAEKLFSAEDSSKAGHLASAEFGVFESVLAGLKARLPDNTWLARLSTLALPTSDVPLARRVVRLRCLAASLTANPRKENPALEACDPDPKGRLGRLARLEVLARAPFLGRRLVAFRELAQSDDVLVRERAIEQLTDHEEVSDAPALLATALGAKAPGEVATAAEVLAKRPDHAGAPSSKRDANVEAAGASEIAPDPKLVEALLRALDTWSKSQNVEVAAALFDAAAALELLGAKPALEAACKHSNPTLRVRAETALRALGERDRSCHEFTPDSAPPPELLHLVHGRQRLTFETDVGQLFIDLDPTLAPVAVTRALELAKQGFYDGHAVHRVVPGFVVQFGDPGGDGYGGADRPLLRCETAPVPFETGAVGVALGGRDTGSSQLFVTLGRHPHLDGNYTLVGRAGPGWDALIEGDRITKVRAGPAE